MTQEYITIERKIAINKLVEHTYATHIYMKLEVDGKEYEVTNRAGIDGRWNDYTTTADGTPDRDKVIEAFNKLY